MLDSPDAQYERLLARYRRLLMAAALLLVVLFSLSLALWIRSASYEVITVASRGLPQAKPVEDLPDELTLASAGFDELPDWRVDDLLAALPAMRTTCRSWSRFGSERRIGVGLLSGSWADWEEFCHAILAGFEGREQMATALGELVVPVSIGNRGELKGLFTGYYEASLSGSRRRHGPYQTALHARPSELVSVDLGDFRPQLQGQRIGGKVSGGRLQPFADRQEISAGALRGRGLEILWVDDPVDAFFLHIQGSGRVEMDDGTTVRVGYSGQNGHAYTAIGRELIARGEISRDEMSMQAIRSWLADHEEAADELMNLNASYIFLRELKKPGRGEPTGPLGSMGLPLTPERSLAVDRRFIPLGLPLWLAAEAPGPGEPELAHLVVAQDTGGAIRGPVRGDLFWGFGERAAELAGPMKSSGRLWALLPKALAEKVLAQASETLDREGP